MIIIDLKFVSLRLARFVLELFCFSSCLSSLVTDENTNNPEIYLLFVSLSFYYIDLICQMFLLQKYFDQYKRTFVSILQFEIWRSETCFHYLRKATIITYSFWNLGYVIYFLVTRPLLNSLLSKALVYFLIVTTLFRYLGFILGWMFFSVMNLLNRPVQNQSVMMAVRVERNVTPSEDECSICLEKNEEEWAALQCHHKFHYECLNRWIMNHNSCPICRLSS